MREICSVFAVGIGRTRDGSVRSARRRGGGASTGAGGRRCGGGSETSGRLVGRTAVEGLEAAASPCRGGRTRGGRLVRWRVGQGCGTRSAGPACRWGSAETGRGRGRGRGRGVPVTPHPARVCHNSRVSWRPVVRLSRARLRFSNANAQYVIRRVEILVLYVYYEDIETHCTTRKNRKGNRKLVRAF
jgi:hypothetical protein